MAKQNNDQVLLLPEDIYTQLGFDKILEHIANDCTGEPASLLALSLRPKTDLQRIKTELTEVKELKETLDLGASWQLVEYGALEDISKIAHIEGYVLTESQVLRIYAILKNIQSIKSGLTEDVLKVTETIVKKIESITDTGEIVKSIERVFDSEGEVREDASPELSRIHKQINARKSAVEASFRKAASSMRSKGLLADNVESFRNGRRVLAVPAEHKRKIKGIIHDESSSGKTVFIEPQEVISINNDLFELGQERKREIRRILRELSSYILADFSQVEQWLNDVTFFDLTLSKARFARKVNATLPEVNEGPRLEVKGARHPLLVLKYLKEDRVVVANDLHLHPPNRLLVLSGPNAGGKSIMLKALGLNQVMLQSGILPAVDTDSKFGIFKSFFVDIGDHQSLEDDLSTYSSHLHYMQMFLEKSDKDTLILIDEFGSGTDPEIGGAIAEALLSAYNDKLVWGMVTTHYPNLKLFAYKTKGLVNGALQFNSDTLKPTFRLQIGKPGSSFAFEIATNVGLDDGVIKHAKGRTGKKYGQIEKLLVDLQSEKSEVEERLASLKEQEKVLTRMRTQYEGLQRELEVRRKKAKIERKELLLQFKAEENKRLEKLINQLKEEQKLQEARDALKESKQLQKESIQEVRTLRKNVAELEPGRGTEPLVAGDHVKLRKSDSVGEIMEIQNNRARVQMGLLTMEVNLDELVKIKNPIERNAVKSVKTELEEPFLTVKRSLDIRGMRMADARELLQKYFDQALMSGLNSVTILHGRGNGVLRKLVWSMVKDYPSMTASHPDEEQGGDGITNVIIN